MVPTWACHMQDNFCRRCVLDQQKTDIMYFYLSIFVAAMALAGFRTSSTFDLPPCLCLVADQICFGQWLTAIEPV